MRSSSSSPLSLHHFEEARQARGDLQQALHNELVLKYRDIAETAAAAYAGRGRELADLRQVAYMGLIKAVRRFDPAVGPHFPAFAVPTIHGELKRYLRDHSWVVRPPRHLQDLRTAIARLQPELFQSLGHAPSLCELSEALGVDAKTVAEALNCQSSLRPESLDAIAGTTGAEQWASADGRLEHAENLAMLRRAVRNLTDADKELLFRRYFHEESQQAIGTRLGLTQMQVSRRLARILVQLQHELLGPSEAAANAARPATA
ncbi:sigma-70 family RNA polymerase sigma factor [Arthrobacter sp. zg-Y40]|uniref:sigma-70 family RNA polymerase sigma factor n=1 Tax=unclassified Arthrobacter TaxID=235627 RepID=UPI001D13FA82|nr:MULTISPECIES: sigma-70 family RNA polymerase sigma factor [unclassified Arthrobacter]MCC3278605.1 sigma-70 family RNA polymerase sigma factor [Arthrobacter sp. zg-Y40]MDK1326316.1 sigma-70 family RNA polymerase sigma factor [Arthrobacter sp. zg-Y1143]